MSLTGELTFATDALSFSLSSLRMQQRLYIDTSVIGGYHDDEFKIITRQFFERIEAKEFLIYFSEVNETELVLAPQNVKEVKLKIPQECLRYLEIDKEAEQLAQTYITEKVLGKASANDAYHIALSSVNRLDCLVSWNFKHIVNFDKIKQFNSINLKLGYPLIDIRTPLEFLKYED